MLRFTQHDTKRSGKLRYYPFYIYNYRSDEWVIVKVPLALVRNNPQGFQGIGEDVP